MKNTSSLLTLFFVLCSFCVSQSLGLWFQHQKSHGMRRQSDILGDLQRAKAYRGKLEGEFLEFQVDEEVKILSQKGLKRHDRIEKLPGQPLGAKVSQYGGYVTVDESAGRALYYYFVEAHQFREYVPLLLWLNGGPGCSSLGYGAMEELGPFRVHSDGKTLYSNPYSWHKAANVLFLESPAGVGFSYSNTSSDYDKSGDKFTASDNYKFLVNWLERFPEYKDREFYISGESYAGHYVPQLAHEILRHNKKANKTIVNLRGIIIGNAVINDPTDNKGMYDFFGSHALVSLETTRKIDKYCDFDGPSLSSECVTAMNEADPNVNDIDIYNIYGPMCFTNNLTAQPKKASFANFDPCSDYYVNAYLNRPEVQKAMHANVTKLSNDWEPCSNLQWGDSTSTVLPLLEEFMANGLRVWVYSGDNDGRVPVTSSQYSLGKLKLEIATEWYPWTHKKEIAGYTQVYKGNLTFATVRGAGHEVPSFQPARALALISHFLGGTLLPKDVPSSIYY